MKLAIAESVRQAVPTFEPITDREVKKQLEIPESVLDHDEDIRAHLIPSAREVVEQDTGVVAATGTYVLKLDCWPTEDFIELDRRPVTAITSIAYIDTNGDSQTWSAANYELDTARVVPAIFLAYDVSWPSLRGVQNAVTITYVAGYATRKLVPSTFKQACRLRCAMEFENRQGTDDERAYDALISRLVRPSYP